jgi:hypothetical protein
MEARTQESEKLPFGVAAGTQETNRVGAPSQRLSIAEIVNKLMKHKMDLASRTETTI